MAAGVLQWLRQIASVSGSARADHELVSRFVERGDEAAFTLLVQRHGPMVYGVCQRLLDRGPDAEDAFQATFLVFVRKARSIRKQPSVSCWLYGVASRVAANLRRKTGRQRSHEIAQPSVPETAAAEATWRNLRAVLDEELAKLPERLRLPIVLCYLDGKTQGEAAQELGLSDSTLRGRLERGRELLRGRLTSRGVTLSSALVATLLTQNAASAVPASLSASTVAAALALAAGKPLAGVVSAKVIGLVLMEVRAMFVSKLVYAAFFVLAATLALGGIAAGTGALWFEAPKDEPVAQKKADEPPADAGEHDDFLRGSVGKPAPLPKELEKAIEIAEKKGLEKALKEGGIRNYQPPYIAPFFIDGVTGKGIPKDITIIAIVKEDTILEKMVGKERKRIVKNKKKLDLDKADVYEPDRPYYRSTIAIEKAHVGKVEKEGNTWWITPTAILILKEAEYRVLVLLGAKELKPAEGDDELRRLLIAKHNAGAQEVTALINKGEGAGIELNASSHLNDVLNSIQRFSATQLELAKTPAERIAALRGRAEGLDRVELACYQGWQLGRIGPEVYYRSLEAKLDAEIQLLKEQRRAK